MGKRTPLYECHRERGARMVDFGGWDMPVHYGSQLEEHHQVRRDAGMFDVSHMTVLDLKGDKVAPFLRHLLANDVARLEQPGKALYSCMLNEQGGVMDDLIVYFMHAGWYRMVVNAATHDKDIDWISKQAGGFAVTMSERTDLAMLALQGPKARSKAAGLLSEAARSLVLDLKPFTALTADSLFVARTGYTGEDGFEVLVPAAEAADYWNRLCDAGFAPCGLGARDTLRLEAGLNLYGQDMDESTSPLESALGWTVAWEPADRQFIGRAALEAVREAGLQRKLVGLILEDKGVLRSHQQVDAGEAGDGEVTSGSYSPTLDCSIGMARIPAASGETCLVNIRGRMARARVVALPFVRRGKILVELEDR